MTADHSARPEATRKGFDKAASKGIEAVHRYVMTHDMAELWEELAWDENENALDLIGEILDQAPKA